MSMQPGWYPDPFSSGGYLRWWDGQRWGTSTSVTSAPDVAPGAPVPPPPPPPGATALYGAGFDPAAAGITLASWGSRAVARILDLLVESAIAAPFAYVLLRPAFEDLFSILPSDGTAPSQATLDAAVASFQEAVLGASVALSLITLVVTFLYEVPQNVRWGRTLGKRALGLRIRPLAADGPLSWNQATIRWGTYAAGALVAGLFWAAIDYLWPLWDKPWRQALHDKTAKTIVVRRLR